MSRSIVEEAKDVQLAVELITLGARLQFLERTVKLSRERIGKLYKEVVGKSPPKGLLPFSAEWYMSWRANSHASLFYNLHVLLKQKQPDLSALQCLMKAYREYLAVVSDIGDTPELDFSRADMLVRYVESDMLHLVSCTRCSGRFVTHAYDVKPKYVCVLCRPPSRADLTPPDGRSVLSGKRPGSRRWTS